jgi:hypothetical protein
MTIPVGWDPIGLPAGGITLMRLTDGWIGVGELRQAGETVLVPVLTGLRGSEGGGIVLSEWRLFCP